MGTIRGKSEHLTARERSKLRIRKIISGSPDRPRISVFKSSKHIYAQVICDKSGVTLASASTRDKDIKSLIEKIAAENAKKEGGNALTSTKSRNAAQAVGLLLAERSKAKNIASIVFDRNGYSYCGRVQALADGARKGGLVF